MYTLDQIQSIYLDELIALHNRIQISYNDMENNLTDLLKDGFVKKKTIFLRRIDISFSSEYSFIGDIQKIKKNILDYFTAIYRILIELDNDLIYDTSRSSSLKTEYKKFIDQELEIIDIPTFKNKLRNYSIDPETQNYGSLRVFYHKIS